MLKFLGANNTDQHPPEYCPPDPTCQTSRLSGQACPQQGIFEPVVCPQGFYCPKEGGKIICPEGSFCPIGSFEAKKCGPGSNCKEGSIRDMSFLGLGILIIVDILLITATIIDKIRDRYKTKRPKARKDKKGFGGGAFGRNNKKYQELHDDHSMEEGGGIPMESRLDFRRRPTGFEQMGAMEADFVLGDEIHDTNGADRTDLQEFVQSLSRILGATKFGLSFEFQNLHFQPPKNPKPILSDVTGLIDAGSLWGVMGASGAGKCKFTLTRGESKLIQCSYFCQRSHGQDIQHRRYHQSQWCGWRY